MLTPTGTFANNTYVLNISPAGGASDPPLGGIRITGLRIGKVATLSNTVHGIYFKVYRGILFDVAITGMSGYGLNIEGRTQAQGGTWNTYESRFDKVFVRECSSSGIRCGGGTADMHFTDCIVAGCLYGMRYEGPGGASCHHVSCHYYSNVNNNVFLDGGGTRSKFVCCEFENSGQHNVNIDVTNGGISSLQFVGCNLNAGGYSANNTYDSFIVQRSSGTESASGVVADCTFQWTSTPDNGGTNKMRYHINFSGAAAQIWRANGNLFDGNAQTAKINNNSSAIRCTFNGLGVNVGDPSSTGNWNGQGEEGLRVVNTSTNTIYEYANGGWRQLN